MSSEMRRGQCLGFALLSHCASCLLLRLLVHTFFVFRILLALLRCVCVCVRVQVSHPCTQVLNVTMNFSYLPVAARCCSYIFMTRLVQKRKLRLMTLHVECVGAKGVASGAWPPSIFKHFKPPETF